MKYFNLESGDLFVAWLFVGVFSMLFVVSFFMDEEKKMDIIMKNVFKYVLPFMVAFGAGILCQAYGVIPQISILFTIEIAGALVIIFVARAFLTKNKFYTYLTAGTVYGTLLMLSVVSTGNSPIDRIYGNPNWEDRIAHSMETKTRILQTSYYAIDPVYSEDSTYSISYRKVFFKNNNLLVLEKRPSVWGKEFSFVDYLNGKHYWDAKYAMEITKVDFKAKKVIKKYFLEYYGHEIISPTI